MKLSTCFRYDLEVQLMNLCDKIRKDFRLVIQRLLFDLQSAHDILGILSKNDLNKFNDIINKVVVVKDESIKFAEYLESLRNAISHKDYKDGQYLISYEKREEANVNR